MLTKECAVKMCIYSIIHTTNLFLVESTETVLWLDQFNSAIVQTVMRTIYYAKS